MGEHQGESPRPQKNKRTRQSVPCKIGTALVIRDEMSESLQKLDSPAKGEIVESLDTQISRCIRDNFSRFELP